MMDVLKRFAEESTLSADLKMVLSKIVALFSRFVNAKESSGDGWEALFQIVLLIRAVSNEFDDTILPLDCFGRYSVSYNSYFNADKKAFEEIVDVGRVG